MLSFSCYCQLLSQNPNSGQPTARGLHVGEQAVSAEELVVFFKVKLWVGTGSYRLLGTSGTK